MKDSGKTPCSLFSIQVSETIKVNTLPIPLPVGYSQHWIASLVRLENQKSQEGRLHGSWPSWTFSSTSLGRPTAAHWNKRDGLLCAGLGLHFEKENENTHRWLRVQSVEIALTSDALRVSPSFVFLLVLVFFVPVVLLPTCVLYS